MARVNWSREELKSSVQAYMGMLANELDKTPYVKAELLRKLMSGSLKGRTKGSIESRFQNISSVLNDMGRPWVNGYKPFSHVGENVKLQIIELINEFNIDDGNTKPADKESKQPQDGVKEPLNQPTTGPVPREKGYSVSPTLVKDGFSSVYIARFGNTNIFKIGYGTSPRERLVEFNKHIPSSEVPELEDWSIFFVSAEMPVRAAYDAEQAILDILKDFRTVGERVKISEKNMRQLLQDFFS